MGRSIVFLVAALTSACISYVGFLIAEMLDDQPANHAGLIYLLSGWMGVVIALILLWHAQHRWQRIVGVLALLANAVSALISFFLWWLYSTPFSTG